jgi:hypothetical protein
VATRRGLQISTSTPSATRAAIHSSRASACYARLSSRGARLPAFSVQLLPPPAGDPALADALAADAAARWGRPRALVEAWYADARARIAATHGATETKTVIGESGTGLRHDPQRPQPEATPPAQRDDTGQPGDSERKDGTDRQGRGTPPAANPQQGRLFEVPPPGQPGDAVAAPSMPGNGDEEDDEQNARVAS